MEINTNDPVFLLSVARISFLSLSEKINLLKNLDSSTSLALLSIEDISKFCNRKIRTSQWDGSKNLLHAQKEAEVLEAKSIKYLTYSSEDYPALLRETPNAPLLLFYRGNKDALKGRSVSVVGTRHISPEAKRAAEQFAYDAVLDGCSVISGLANGVDGAAHTGCINAFFDAKEKGLDVPEGKTIAVLPCGIDGIVPYGHTRLAQNIISSGGCIISEYVPGVPAEKWRFVQRNRIVAALSPATVVIQAPAGSGALITAQLALEYNRDVMFHQAAFESQSRNVTEQVQKRLEVSFAQGIISRSKLENTPERFLEAGAPVIKDYQDYCRCLSEIPGARSNNVVQLKLFEEID